LAFGVLLLHSFGCLVSCHRFLVGSFVHYDFSPLVHGSNKFSVPIPWSSFFRLFFFCFRTGVRMPRVSLFSSAVWATLFPLHAKELSLPFVRNVSFQCAWPRGAFFFLCLEMTAPGNPRPIWTSRHGTASRASTAVTGGVLET